MAEPKETKEGFNHLVRIVNTDIDGNKSTIMGLQRIKGIGFMFSNMVCNAAGVDKLLKVGYLKEDQIKKIEDVVKNPSKYGTPSWMLNRRKDPEDGADKHLLTTDLTFTKDNDIKLMKKIKSWKGFRHSLGQPVRGQRTRSNFRKNKGKVVGVVKSKMQKAAAAEKAAEKK